MKYSKRRVGTLIILTAVFGIGLTGCGSGFVPPNDASAVQEVEPNNTFNEAQVVTIPSAQTLRVNGMFANGSDVDVFSLGTFQAGRTLSAELSGDNAVNPNNVQFGFFDQDQQVAILDDNAATAADQKVSFVVRKSGKYYLALAAGSSSSFFAHSYSVLITVGSGAVPTPAKEIVYLNFNGVSSVTISGTTFNNVLPFSALGNGMNPQTVAAQVTAAVAGDYAPYDMQILSSYDAPEPSGPHSTVYVSAGTNQSFYGLSDDVDWYNENLNDRSIIFAGALTGNGLSQTQFVTALANITAHEMGHLSGLAHTFDHTELMDQTTPMKLLDRAQTFHDAPLAEFPIGDEDTPELLQFALGLLN
jgi:hypothetical protein